MGGPRTGAKTQSTAGAASSARSVGPGRLPVGRRRWAAVTAYLLAGVILLNPRIMEYDVAPITLPLALIAWRFFARFTTTPKTLLCLAILLAAANGIAAFGWYIRKLVDGPLLVLIFAVGCWMLMRPVRKTGLQPLEIAR